MNKLKLTNSLAQTFQENFVFQIKKEELITLGTNKNDEEAFHSAELQKESTTNIILSDNKNLIFYEFVPHDGATHVITSQELETLQTDLMKILMDISEPDEQYDSLVEYFNEHQVFSLNVLS